MVTAGYAIRFIHALYGQHPYDRAVRVSDFVPGPAPSWYRTTSERSAVKSGDARAGYTIDCRSHKSSVAKTHLMHVPKHLSFTWCRSDSITLRHGSASTRHVCCSLSAIQRFSTTGSGSHPPAFAGARRNPHQGDRCLTLSHRYRYVPWRQDQRRELASPDCRSRALRYDCHDRLKSHGLS